MKATRLTVLTVLALLLAGAVFAQVGGLNVKGFPSYKADENRWQLFVSRDGEIKSQGDLLANARGFGDINSDGTVKWSSPPFPSSDDFFLYIVKSGGGLMKTPSVVTITNGGGTVDYSTFIAVK